MFTCPDHNRPLGQEFIQGRVFHFCVDCRAYRLETVAGAPKALPAGFQSYPKAVDGSYACLICGTRLVRQTYSGFRALHWCPPCGKFRLEERTDWPMDRPKPLPLDFILVP